MACTTSRSPGSCVRARSKAWRRGLYGRGADEELLAEVLADRRAEVVLATKFGIVAGPDGRPAGVNGRPEYARQACEALDRNLALVGAVREIAEAHGATAGRVALAWPLAQGTDVAPIPGTKRVRYLEENAGARRQAHAGRSHPSRRAAAPRATAART